MKKLIKNHQLFSQRGSAIMMAMISAAIMGGIIYMMMQSKKTATFNQNKEISNSDVDRAAADLGSMLANPAHCNATFRNLALPAIDTNPTSLTYKTSPSSLSTASNPPGIVSFTFKRCPINTSGNVYCSLNPPTSFGSPVDVMKYPQDTDPTKKWKLFLDDAVEYEAKTYSRGYAKAAINKIEYQLVRPQTVQSEPIWVNSWGAKGALPATLRLTVQFKKYLGRTANGAEIIAMSRDYIFEFYVITGTFSGGTLSPSIPTQIIGCARTSETTLVY